MTKTFRHAGDRGDILASLPAIRALGGGVLLIEAANYTREKLTPDNWLGIDKLLREQPYIADVQPWIGQRVNFNLNDFRARLFQAVRKSHYNDKNLADWQLEQYGIPLSAKDTQWLTVAEPIKAARVVFSRSGPGRRAMNVYQNPLFPWHHVWAKYGKEAVFVGTEQEHRVFSGACGDVPHYRTADLHEAARVIAGAELWVGNQSAPFWIAAGLFKRIVLEVWTGGPNSCLSRDGIVNGWDENVGLPEL